MVRLTIAKRYVTMNPKSKLNKIEQLIELYGSICCWCCKQLKRDEITVEHLLPKSYNGSDALDNLCLACQSCNNSRGNRLVPPKYSPQSIGNQKILECLKTTKHLPWKKLKE